MFRGASTIAQNHVQTMRYARLGPKREFRFILPSQFPSLNFPQTPGNSLSGSFEKFRRSARHSLMRHYSITSFKLHFEMQNRMKAAARASAPPALPQEETMIVVRSRYKHTRPQNMRWMSLTSRLVPVPSEPPSLACPTPQGRAMAAEKGRPVPLVSRSERHTDVGLPIARSMA